MSRFSCHALCLLYIIPFSAIWATPQDPPAAISSYSPPEVPGTIEGFQSQMNELVRIAKTHDRAAWTIALNSFALPDIRQWLEDNFAAQYVAQLNNDYPGVREGHLNHISWVLGNNADASGFIIKVEPSEMPAPVADSGFESLLPRPLRPVSLQNFRLTAIASSGSMPPSWVSSFVFVDGHFRVIGGTYPFWAEKLSPFRGPMALPPAIIHGRTVQGIAFRRDLEGGIISGIVQLKIKVERDGHVSKINVVSGDKELIDDAKSYLKAAKFSALPNVPQLANAERNWEFEVAFFAPKT